LKYRADIDGLRAVAVLPVIFFHAGFDFFSGGFIGVDVFFVISGFLITNILLEEIESRNFSILSFYERRARRILPALFVVIIVCVPFAWMWMLPSQLKDFSKSIAAVGIFISNVLFWTESNYFDLASELKPLLHTWSLAVEEQYYIVFPLFLIVLWRFGCRKALIVLIFFVVLSVSFLELIRDGNQKGVFFLSHWRAWELVVGSICAFVLYIKGLKENEFFSFIGLSLIILCILLYSHVTPFPGLYTMVPVLGASLVILFSGEKTLVSRFLNIRILVGVGLISYSAYLWHQPIFAFSRIISAEELDWWIMGVLSMVTLLIAYFSWKYIEMPFRRKEFLNRKKIYLFSVSGMLCLVVLGLLGSEFSDEIRSGYFNKYNRQIEYGKYERDNKLLQLESWGRLRGLSGNYEYGVEGNYHDLTYWFSNKNRPGVIVVGNSHSKDIYNILSASASIASYYNVARFGVQIRDLNKNHLFWKSPNYLFSKFIVIASRYSKEDVNNIQFVIDRIISDNKTPILVSNIFEFPEVYGDFTYIDKIAYLSYYDGLSIKDAVSRINRKYFEFYKNDLINYSIIINDELRRIAEINNVIYLDRMDYICDEYRMLCYAVQDDLSKNFYDYGHHTAVASGFFAEIIDRKKWFSVE